MNKIFPDGHFCSPILSETDIKYSQKYKQHENSQKTLPGIKIDELLILNNIRLLGDLYKQSTIRFPMHKNQEYRFFFDNHMFSYMDAIILSLWIQYLKPKRIIEIGSGFSSCVMLDTCDKAQINTEFAFIEPYADRLKSLTDTKFLIEKYLQDVDIVIFEKLEPNDILFIDSSHVAKAGSDVNHIIHRILPLLKSGVYVHIHDVFWPFEYPEYWLNEGRCWNEIYMLRAFLEYNDKFEIQYFNDYIYKFYKHEAETFFPEINKNPGGSIWLRKK